MAGRILFAALIVGWLTAQGFALRHLSADDEAKPVDEIRRELLAWRKALDSDGQARATKRAVAMAGIRGTSDPRAVPTLFELWEKENTRKGSHLVRGHFVEGLIHVGDRKAFLKLAEISVEDEDPELRRRAATWIGGQDNRDHAIPIYTKYLKTKHYFHQALTALGYAEIATKGKQPPDRDLVAALIDNLITVTPVRKRVPRSFDTGWNREGHQFNRVWGTQWIWVTEYVPSENSAAKDLLYQYCLQDHGFDQKAWRDNVLRNLDSSTQPRQ